MHLLSMITALTALSAGALAMPAPGNETTLEKRGFASICAFTDNQCGGRCVGEQPRDVGSCIKYTPETNFVGINWGNTRSFGRAKALHVYKSDNCYGLYHIVKSTLKNAGDGPNFCTDQRQYGNGGWRSMWFDTGITIRPS